MNLFKGLEKFGLKTEGTENLFEEEKRTNASTEQGEAKEEIPSEESFLLEKSVRCTVCDKVFKTKMIKNGRVKRLEPDFDLRPRFMYIDTLKYDVASCPNCGYTAMNRYFEHLSSVQIKLIKEKICANFKPTGEEPAVYDYDTAINRYKLALFNTLVKKGKASEKAYTCLKISWLYRGKLEGMDEKDASLEQERRECLEQQEAEYFHTSDLDYGGIRIFMNIKEKIFPDVKPLAMDGETFFKYQEYGEKRDEKYLQKVRDTEVPAELKELKDYILKTGCTIEQESMLF